MVNATSKSKNLIVVAASENYLAGINALFNSIDYWKIDADVLLVSWKLPQEYIKKAQEVFNFNIKVIESEHSNQTQGTAYERFKYAVEYGKDYEAICMLDADIFFTADVARFFFVASKGVIITGNNGMVINFNKSYQDQYQTYLGSDEYPYPLIHTTAPIFLPAEDLDWFDELYKSRRISSFDDFHYLNILGIKMGKDKRMISLAPTTFCQIHHFGIKPVTHLIKKEGMLLDGMEMQVYSVHGKWFDEGWYTGLMMPMEGYFRDNHFGEYQEQLALDARELTLNEFLKYCYLQKLNLRDFVHIQWLENKLSNISD